MVTVRGGIVERTQQNALQELAVRTVCVRAIAGKTTSQRDIYRAIHAHRFYPNQEAVLRDIMTWLPSSRYVRIAGTNRSGWGIMTATEAGVEFYTQLVNNGAFKMRRRRAGKPKAGSDAAFLDDLFKDTKF